MTKAESYIKEMEGMVINYLLDKHEEYGEGYGFRKHSISEHTGIPNDFLTPILRRLKYDRKIELIMIWDEATSLPNGSGYAIASTF